MWIMTSFGILMPSDRTAYTPEGDPRTLQVRARRARELDILRSLYLPELGETIHTPTFDYNYRAYCTPEQFAEAAANMVRDIDYEKFKPTTDRFNDDELHGVYNSIWSNVTALGTPWEGLGEYHGGSYYGGSGYFSGSRAVGGSTATTSEGGKGKGKGKRGRHSRRRGRSDNGSASTAHYSDRYARETIEMDELDDLLDRGAVDTADQGFWEDYDRRHAASAQQELDFDRREIGDAVLDAMAVHSTD